MKGRRGNSLLAEFHLGNCFVLLDFFSVFGLCCMDAIFEGFISPRKAGAVLHTSGSVPLKRKAL